MSTFASYLGRPSREVYDQNTKKNNEIETRYVVKC